MGQIVIDASVFLKLISEEVYSEKAYEIRDAYISKKLDILVPSVFPYEVLNALRYSKAFKGEELESVVDAIEDYGFGSFEMNRDFAKKVATTATRYNITVYDASYIALAAITDSNFYTTDQKLLDNASLPFVKHLKDFVGD
jgi:predicted nucleic acid-binding protein